MSPMGSLTTDKLHLCNYPRRGDPLSWITPASLPRNELVAPCVVAAWALSPPCRCGNFCQLHHGISAAESAASLPAGSSECVNGQQIVPNLRVLKTAPSSSAAGAASSRFRVMGDSI